MTTIWTHDPAAAFVPAPQLQAGLDPVWIETERPEDHDARETLLDRAFGPARFGKTCERLRARRLPAAGPLPGCASPSSWARRRRGRGFATGRHRAPLARRRRRRAGADARPARGRRRRPQVRPGRAPLEAAIDRAAALGHRAIILVGDAPYYARFGFSRAPVMDLEMPARSRPSVSSGSSWRPVRSTRRTASCGRRARAN